MSLNRRHRHRERPHVLSARRPDGRPEQSPPSQMAEAQGARVRTVGHGQLRQPCSLAPLASRPCLLLQPQLPWSVSSSSGVADPDTTLPALGALCPCDLVLKRHTVHVWEVAQLGHKAQLLFI